MDLVVIFGPPASGKLTLARKLCEHTGYGLLQGDLPLESLSNVFGWASPSSAKLGHEFRRRILEEAVATDVLGIVMTLVWALDAEAHVNVVDGYCDFVSQAGGRVQFLELYAEREARLVRYGAAQPEDLDTEALRGFLFELDAHYVMNSGPGQSAAGELLATYHHERVDTTDLSPGEVAAVVETALALAGVRLAAAAVGRLHDG
jgi:hypothetical protein